VFVVLKMACQDDDDDDEVENDAEEAEHDCALVESAGELVPTLVKLIGGPTFAPYFAELLPELLKRLVCNVIMSMTVRHLHFCSKEPILQSFQQATEGLFGYN